MNKNGFKIRLVPVILFTAVVFLAVKAQSFNLDIDNMLNIPLDSSMELWDVFCYTKSKLLLFLTVWAALTMAYLLIIGRMKLKRTVIYIPMAVYTLGVLASYALSDYKGVSWLGNADRFEGTRTILCYMFMLFYTINVVDELRDAVIIVATTASGVLVACVLGITQLVGHDFLLTDIGRRIIAGDNTVEAQFQTGRVYQTVSNMNYVGMYLVLIVPILIFVIFCMISGKYSDRFLTVGLDAKKRLAIGIAAGVLLILIALNLYGAGTLGGVLGLAASIAALLVVLLGRRWQKIFVSAVFLIGLAASVVYIYMTNTDTNKVIDYICTERNLVRISIDGNELNIIYDREDDEYKLCDKDVNPIGIFWFAEEEGIIQIDSDDRFSGKIALIPYRDSEGIPCITLLIKDADNQLFSFRMLEDGAKYINPYGQEVSLDKVDSCGFNGHLSVGSGRGYIWSRTIPLLRDRLITGSGADTFLYIFPQDDYAGKYSAGTPLEVTCDKPHNMYLNIAVGTGGISLIAFIVMSSMALFGAFRSGQNNIFAKVIAAGIIGFLFSGLVNDSSICVMPMFYGLLGTIIGMCPSHNS